MNVFCASAKVVTQTVLVWLMLIVLSGVVMAAKPSPATHAEKAIITHALKDSIKPKLFIGLLRGDLDSDSDAHVRSYIVLQSLVSKIREQLLGTVNTAFT